MNTESQQRFEAKLLNFADDERIKLCEPCLREAMTHNLVIFSSALPDITTPATVAEGSLPESTATCHFCQRGIYNSAIGWMHSHSGDAGCVDDFGLHQATPVVETQCDTCNTTSPSIHCGTVAPAPVQPVAAEQSWATPHVIHEDELPSGISKEDYDTWYLLSWIQDGVRVGPRPPSTATPGEAAAPTDALVQLLCAALERPEAAEGYIRRVSEELQRFPPTETAQVAVEALQDLFALVERQSDGRWCFKSLSRDASKFDAVMERLSATPAPADAGEVERLSEQFKTLEDEWIEATKENDQLRVELSVTQKERDRFFRELADTQGKLTAAVAVIDVGTDDDPGTAITRINRIERVVRANAIRECAEKVKSLQREYDDEAMTTEDYEYGASLGCAVQFADKAITALESLAKEEDDGPR